jgi:hypothetical protein
MEVTAQIYAPALYEWGNRDRYSFHRTVIINLEYA